ncbi:hypothetical protein E3T34_00380 [Cryobacterium sp. TMT1-62]|uniref:Uncharacterized protein n=1 Tax=Cryobacterium sandaracinum TaxID=1259247 RepID=A0ABY2JIK0_9MICO|nr:MULTISPECIES: hypothetical protein [Cryobacterium]TFB53305.1 hypothetical protein E3N94_15140 [Cryobacterium sp. Sr3]TFC35142.1 hypothetical protein E3O28_10445 [Cryobacterium sp. TMT2-14]TFC51477.1 hypothetical protein E3O47_06995 [Cryobacterium sp. TMT2-17-1]TFD06779.1 hypothetical protein E3T25_01245 [Cryobacterium sandaracinum]TFD36752.1 hypothetical protein E3T34_00380 [Cryobacterium sp. TMT1-62]
MRSRIWIISLAAGALLAAGTVAPAYAAEGSSPPAPAGQAEDSARGHMAAMHRAPGLVKMHEQMMAGMSDTADMTAGAPGMAKMHEQMMAHHPAGDASSEAGNKSLEASR